VFVADSQRRQLEENVQSLRDMHEVLAEQGVDARTLPLVMQYNKQDLPRDLVMTPHELDDALNFRGVPTFAGDALAGTGVFETLRKVSQLVLQCLGTPAAMSRER
jgi:hypothetical protein